MASGVVAPRIEVPDFPFDWLVPEIRNGYVVPVIGSELYVDDNGELLEPRVAQQLASDLGLRDIPATTLRAVALAYLEARRGGGANAILKAKARAAIQATIPHPPGPIRQLAEVEAFPLYVTTTPDLMLETALDSVGRQAVSVSYREQPDVAIPAELSARRPVVCHTFGSLNDTFALTDADVLELIQSLASDRLAPTKLFDALSLRSLLFLGCGFPDWLARLFIRVMRKRRFGEQDTRSHVIADRRVANDDDLMRFLQHYEVLLYQTGRAAQFVEQVHERCVTARTPPPADAGAPPPPLAPGSVFLSFSSLDRDSVRAIANALHDHGIDVFFDEQSVERGSHWDSVIIDNLSKAVLFIPFISRNTELDAEQPRYFRREWNIAERRADYYLREARFILPVDLDGLDPQRARVPEAFRAVQWFRLQQRVATPEFIAFVVEEYRRKKLSGGNVPGEGQ